MNRDECQGCGLQMKHVSHLSVLECEKREGKACPAQEIHHAFNEDAPGFTIDLLLSVGSGRV